MLHQLPKSWLKFQEGFTRPAIKPLYECSICGDRECESVRVIPFVDCGEEVKWEVCDKHSPEEIAKALP